MFNNITDSKVSAVAEQLVDDICYQLHRHEVQYWKDAPGTLEERAAAALSLARDLKALLSGRCRPEDCGDATSYSERCLQESGGIVDAP